MSSGRQTDFSVWEARFFEHWQSVAKGTSGTAPWPTAAAAAQRLWEEASDARPVLASIIHSHIRGVAQEERARQERGKAADRDLSAAIRRLRTAAVAYGKLEPTPLLGAAPPPGFRELLEAEAARLEQQLVLSKQAFAIKRLGQSSNQVCVLWLSEFFLLWSEHSSHAKRRLTPIEIAILLDCGKRADGKRGGDEDPETIRKALKNFENNPQNEKMCELARAAAKNMFASVVNRPPAP
jgi:hypothetical protein